MCICCTETMDGLSQSLAHISNVKYQFRLLWVIVTSNTVGCGGRVSSESCRISEKKWHPQLENQYVEKNVISYV